MAPSQRDQRIAELEGQLQKAEATITALKARIAQLEQRLADLERAGKRPATPFARDEHKADPKKPGRKAGQGLFSYRSQFQHSASRQPVETETSMAKLRRSATLRRARISSGTLTSLKT